MRRAALFGVAAASVVVVSGVAVLAVGSLTSGGHPAGHHAGHHAEHHASPSTQDGSVLPSGEIDLVGLDPSAQAVSFLDEWVDDGRVVRRDEGGDTVSEGQAYGLLAAVIARDEESFDEIWDWTTAELVRDDGLMAWRWDKGQVVDDEPASDADLDAARALVLAGDRFDRPDLREHGVDLATVVADRLTVETSLGRILLPGLWAAEREPYAYNPSYASPAAFAVLEEATDDERWAELQDGSAAVTSKVLDATALPPDWAQVHSDGQINPMPGPLGQGDPVQYGFDAPRTVLRYAESCVPSDVKLAGKTFAVLDREVDIAARLDLGGGPLSEDRSPLSFTARAAAAAAAGDVDASRADLDRAASLATDYPTYYGHAWVMLSTAMLTTDDLGGCPALTGAAS
ncbi:endoglucanase [Promicromonospora umidemergens]|uniref:Endoglucanase n=1 Tax=Promicromonospora umidemergens TaxID=629679 RepID=A0ABP8XMP3_9MICO|nr:glycosyl hydrolase family 8 [Promicromonospora umidemergens]MCP2285685.1 endoglucanase [Promicromonospora umidemergens]